MGELRKRAEAEVEAERLEAEQRQHEHDERLRRQLAERAAPAAEYLAKWSGEKVDPADLVPMDGPGPPRYSIELDGFQLLVEVYGEPPEARRFLVLQELPGAITREARLPRHLLEPIERGPPQAADSEEEEP